MKTAEQSLPLSTEYILIPAIIKEIAKFKNKKILDLGCGDGSISRILAKQGAKVTAIDKSEEKISQAISLSKDFKIDYKVMNGAELSDLESDYYDFVIMNMVLLEIPTFNQANEVFDEVSRVLDTEGKLLFTDLNPISFVNNISYIKHSLPANFSYFMEGGAYSTEELLSNNKKIFYDDYHHTLESYTKMLENAGMYIQKIVEPKAVEKSPEELSNQKFPEFILFCCKLFDE